MFEVGSFADRADGWLGGQKSLVASLPRIHMTEFDRENRLGSKQIIHLSSRFQAPVGQFNVPQSLQRFLIAFRQCKVDPRILIKIVEQELFEVSGGGPDLIDEETHAGSCLTLRFLRHVTKPRERHRDERQHSGSLNRLIPFEELELAYTCLLFV